MTLPMRLIAAGAALSLLGGCATVPDAASVRPVTVKIIGLNDFHGNIGKPREIIMAPGADGARVPVPAGGGAWLASAVDSLKAQNPNHLVLSAGDMIGGSPLASSLYLDEPAIGVMNRIKIDFNAVGNHEFDRGRDELLRMQNGGCAKHTARTPCAIEPDFKGADFGFLAANVVKEDGSTLFPATAMRSFGSGAGEVKIGIIGLTLEGTPALVMASGIAGLTFADEVQTINPLVNQLKAQGADAVIVVIHEGLFTTTQYEDKSCGGISGDLAPILEGLDPRVDLVISGHTHWSYVCNWAEKNPAKPFLATSAGKYGSFISDIDLTIDPVAGKVIARRADNIIVQNDGVDGQRGRVNPSPLFPQFAARADVAAYVKTYEDAAQGFTSRKIARLPGPAQRSEKGMEESVLGNLIADAMLVATRDPAKGGAQIALMNSSGVRTALEPGADGFVTYGQLYTVQPFNNNLIVMTLNGAQLMALLEQQLDEVGFNQLFTVSDGFRFGYDLSRPAGRRIVMASLNGQPIDPARDYRIVTNNFLAGGGDNFSAFRQGRALVTGPVDLDATEAYLVNTPDLKLPALGRISVIGATPTP